MKRFSPNFFRDGDKLPPLDPGDVVRVPSGREAVYESPKWGRLSLRYLDDDSEVVLPRHLLVFVRRGVVQGDSLLAAAEKLLAASGGPRDGER